MRTNKTERLNGIVAALNDYIDLVRAYDLDGTAALLRMAKLDLQMHIHDISDQELQALCEAVEEGQLPADAPPRSSRSSPRLGRSEATMVLPATPVSDRILLESPRSSKRFRRM